MKLIQHTTLYFQQGSSDKVYEVELSEVGAGQYVVNFRYGRRGANLKEGSKTDAPVNLAQAQAIYDKLVAEKTSKGYAASGASAAPATQPTPTPPTKPTKAKAHDPRAEHVLSLLATGGLQDLDAEWPLSRVVWRAGELRLTDAEPHLWRLIGLNDMLVTRSALVALARVGSAHSLGPLGRFIADAKQDATLRRIAEHTRWVLSDAAGRAIIHEDMIARLPTMMARAARERDPQALRDRLDAEVRQHPQQLDVLVHRLSLMLPEVAAPALHHYARTAPLLPPHFRVIRALFKAAELRRDPQLYGILAHRFERTSPRYQLRARWNSPASWGKASDIRNFAINPTLKPYTNDYVYLDGQYHHQLKRATVASPETPFSFSRATRDYLRRRVWRTLRRMGELNDPDFVPMAVGVLLPFTDADGVHARKVPSSTWDASAAKWRPSESHYGPFSAYVALNHLLHAQQHKHEHRGGVRFWRQRPRVNHAPRDEAFPALWEAQPQGLLHLLDESRCELVHEFAARALSDCAEFTASLPFEALMMLLEAPYPVTAALGFDLLTKSNLLQSASPALLARVATCNLLRAREQAVVWLRAQASALARDADALQTLLWSRHDEGRALLDEVLRAHKTPPDIAQRVVTAAAATILASADDAADASALGAVTLLASHFSAQLTSLGTSTIQALLEHGHAASQALAGEALLARDRGLVTGAQIEHLMSSPFAPARALGMQLFARLEDRALLSQEALLVGLMVNERADLRAHVRPLLARLAAFDAAFAERLTALLIQTLLVDEPQQGLHAELVAWTREALGPHLEHLPTSLAQDLLRARTSAARELGAVLLRYAPPDALTLLELVHLGRHEILAAREAAWSMLERDPARALDDLVTTLRMADSPWQDTREFMFAFLTEHVSAQAWTPALLVSLCDSTRPDVQRFGQRMIQTFFVEEHGQDYLLRLSEHPSPDLQLFATNYLERFASGKPELLESMRFYLTSILSRVNRGGVARRRIFDFLEAEALRDPRAASFVAELLGRQIVTCSVQDRARALQIMVRAQAAHPMVDQPITVIPVEVRRGV